MNLKIIRTLENGSSQRVVAEKFGVSKFTVADIWKDHQKISKCVDASDQDPSDLRYWQI
jgi:transposase